MARAPRGVLHFAIWCNVLIDRRCSLCVAGLVYAMCDVASAAKVEAQVIPLPSSEVLTKQIQPYLMKPLPAVQTIAGVAMPTPAPLMVVASLGDDEAVPDLDRGYAVGFTLNELLFDADPQLDVLPPWYYAYDTREKGAPTGTKRDSAANARRAGSRDDARWCVHGRVSGAAPTRVNLVVEGCSSSSAPRKREWTVKTDNDWPATLAEMCEFASAAATGQLTAKARDACARARETRPTSLLALARYGGPKEKRAWKTLETMLEADPKFPPVAVEYLTWLYYDSKQRQAFWDRIGVVAHGAPESSAVQMIAYSRAINSFGWKIDLDIYQRYFVWLRKHSYLSSAWLVLASGLSLGSPSIWPPSEPLTPGFMPDAFPIPAATKTDYPPNEATHAACLAISLAIYRDRPNAYRSLWMLGYALERYGWMLRGSNFWRDVPDIGKRGFPVFVEWADRFNVATLRKHPDADAAWVNHMNTTMLSGGDWMPIFYRAVEVNPRNTKLYEDAMMYALPQWNGAAETRRRIADVAVAKNPDAAWAKSLLERYEEQAKKYLDSR